MTRIRSEGARKRASVAHSRTTTPAEAGWCATTPMSTQRLRSGTAQFREARRCAARRPPAKVRTRAAVRVTGTRTASHGDPRRQGRLVVVSDRMRGKTRRRDLSAPPYAKQRLAEWTNLFRCEPRAKETRLPPPLGRSPPLRAIDDPTIVLGALRDYTDAPEIKAANRPVTQHNIRRWPDANMTPLCAVACTGTT
ncbi:hypothetical protein MRX96_011835 [Rhipicephalus microplus]